jgi:hypothetical protein
MLTEEPQALQSIQDRIVRTEMGAFLPLLFLKEKFSH